ncbi:hypothetical protein GW932_02260 [archaeon]|nr:hypothetical protein [archaeon]
MEGQYRGYKISVERVKSPKESIREWINFSVFRISDGYLTFSGYDPVGKEEKVKDVYKRLKGSIDNLITENKNRFCFEGD